MSIDTSPEGLARRKADLIALRDSGAGIWPEDVVLALIDALEEARAALLEIASYQGDDDQFDMTAREMRACARSVIPAAAPPVGVDEHAAAQPYSPQRDLPMPKYEYQNGELKNEHESAFDRDRRNS